jgi:peptidoglycan/LPS O-acetylase OafA/YrhL
MQRGLSIWLDFLRVAATVVVVASHLAYPRFTNGDWIILRDWNVGSDAVVLFFVVSGFVIAYAAGRDGALGLFGFNRVTRLLSVIIPALFLTAVFDRVGYAIDPTAYPAAFYNPLPLWEMLARGVTFSNEFAFPDRVRLGTNGPLWSLSYEAAYYAVFAVAVFMKGARRVVVLAVMAVVFGPRILLLMPAWLMGVWLWYRVSNGGFATLTPVRAWCLAIGPVGFYLYAQMIDLPAALYAVTAAGTAPLHPQHMLGFSDEALWNGLIGVLVTLHLIGVIGLAKDTTPKFGWIRWAAGASFSVYVTHYPALHLMDAALPADMTGRYAALFVGSIVVGLCFAEVFERKIKCLRHSLMAFAPKKPTTTAIAAE